MKFYQILTLLILTILPFFPIQIDGRIPYIMGGFALLLIPLFVKNLKEDLAKKNIVTIFFLLFLAAGALSTVFSIDQKQSITQLIVYISCFVVFTSIRSIFPTLRSREFLTFYFLLLTSILSLISLYHTLFLHYVNRETEGVSFMWIYYGHNHLAALLLFAMPLALYFLKTHWKNHRIRLLLLTVCYLLLFSLFFTLARSAILSLFLATVISFLVFPNIIKARLRAILFTATLFTLLVFLFGVFASNHLFPKASYRVGMPLNEKNSRIVYWKQAVANFQKHPLFGSGLDTFRIVNKREPTKKGTIGSYYAHNFILQMLSDAGILGGLTSLGLIVSVLWQGLRKVRSAKLEVRSSIYVALFIGILASTLISMLDMGWQLPVVFLIFWIFAGFFRRSGN